jgi:outer membrane protein TolC
MQQARSQLYNTRASIPAIEFTKSQALNALAFLLSSDAADIKNILEGKGKQQTDNFSKYIVQSQQDIMQLKESGSGFSQVNMIPQAHINPYKNIDAQLLTRRPDIKVAQYRAQAQNAQIGSSMAELYPSFSLFGNIGYNSNNSRGAWLSGSEPLGVTVGPSFSWNIFHYDRIKNKIRLQDALFEESLVNYNKSVLTAVSEVSNALEGYMWTQKQQTEIKKAVDATIRAFNISVVQYNDGLVGYERLLTTVEKLTSTQDRYAVINGNLSLQAIALYKALGGGWHISQGESYLSEDTASRMKKTVDWGRYLDANMTQIPKGM